MRRRRAATCVVVAGLLAIAVAPTASAQSCATSDDRAAVAGVQVRVEAIGALVWHGWHAAPPVLLRSGDVDCLFGHPAPPAAFEAIGPGVARLVGHVVPVPAATAFEVGGVWSVAVPTRAELQAFVDEHLGRGLVVLDDALYARTLFHEAFHAFQLSAVGGPAGVPEFGPTASLADVAGHPSFDVAQTAQGAALHDALTAATAGGIVAAIERFVLARDEWRASAPHGTTGLELQLEWLEGTARYADTLAALVPVPEPLGRAGEVWGQLLGQVREPTSVATGARDRYAALGAAQAFVLDRVLPGWRARVIPGGASLEELLRDVADGVAGVPAALAGMAIRTVVFDGTHWRLAVADAPEHWAQGLQDVVFLGSVDGVWFVFPHDVEAPFWMRGARLPLDIAFFDGEGRLLATRTMPTCGVEPCPTYRPDRPYRSALETLAGRLVGRVGPGRLTTP